MKTLKFLKYCVSIIFSDQYENAKCYEEGCRSRDQQYTLSLKQHIESLESSGLFHRLFYVKSFGLIKSFWRVPDKNKPEVFEKFGYDFKKGEIDFTQYNTYRFSRSTILYFTMAGTFIIRLLYLWSSHFLRIM